MPAIDYFTLAILKPDAVAQGYMGNILSIIEREFIGVVELQMMTLTDDQARQFYWGHRRAPYYEGLVAHTASGPCVALLLRATTLEPGESAPSLWRSMMPLIRETYGTSGPKNAVHGSDSTKEMLRELQALKLRSWIKRWLDGDPNDPQV